MSDGRARLTNLPWLLDASDLGRALGVRAVWLLNDLEATAYAVPHLLPGDLETLHPGDPAPGDVVAVIAPGTGLGESFMTWDGSRYRAHPSEGGHCDFAPTDETEIELLRFLLPRFDHVSVERACSGIGLPNIYDFLRDRGPATESPEIAGRLAAAHDRTPLIVEGALAPGKPSPLCAAALDLFVAILGAEASNLALKVLATGGVYLAWGIPKHIMPGLVDGRFMRAFLRKGRLAEWLCRVPVHVMTVDAPLLGAATYGLDMLRG